MTGNDIISLPLIQAQTRTQRFAQKILQPSELSKAEKGGEFSTNLYLFWACKEAAYKIDRKKGIKRKINPKQYLVKMNNNRLEVASEAVHCLYTGSYSCTNEYIHVILWEKEDQVTSHILSMGYTNIQKQSKQLYEHISKELSGGDRVIRKDDQNIPRIYGWDISLSHCGQWGAWSAIKQ